MNRQLTTTAIPAVACALLAAFVSAQSTGDGTTGVRGFSARAASAELAREQEFKRLPSSKLVEEYFDVMTAEPHHTGSPYEIELAEYVAGKFKEYGLEVTRHEYSVLIPWPGERVVEIVAPDRLTLQVDEEILPGDRFASKSGILPAYHAYSPSGDVTGELVYVNYGIAADYETLAKMGIDAKGKIVIARYGRSWRGVKPKLAAEHGAIGCIIYSDPKDDGYYLGDVYPKGPWRGWGMIQRGSVLDMPRYPGDPLTPGRPSKPGVERLPMEKVETFAPIPVLPMSYRDGAELLKRLQGQIAPADWRGALPLTYRTGPGPAKAHMQLRMDYKQRRLINVVGKFVGATLPDEWVIIGVHRDAWAFGASDSVSSHVSVMDVARSFGELIRKGWQPRRTLVFASWDGEEQGLLGSTEWVEDFESEIKAKAVVYVNRDGGATRGWFNGSAVQSLTPFVREVAQAVQDLEWSSRTLYDSWLEHARVRNPPRQGEPPPTTPVVGTLGAASDYAAFLHHVGVSALDVGIGDETSSGTYHSIYDHPLWFKRFMDPGFKVNAAATRVTGIALMRLAEAELLPFDYETYGREILGYVDEIENEARQTSEAEAAKIGFTDLRSAAEGFAKAGADIKTRGESLLESPLPDAVVLNDLNRRIVQAERDLIQPGGLPDRPWYRHTIYAPGLYTGYDVKTIPGVREAVEAGDFKRAAEQTKLVVEALRRATKTLKPD